MSLMFQETSAESFEESLMAGGYGRYKTAEWRPAPLSPVGPPASPHKNGQEASPRPPPPRIHPVSPLTYQYGRPSPGQSFSLQPATSIFSQQSTVGPFDFASTSTAPSTSWLGSYVANPYPSGPYSSAYNFANSNATNTSTSFPSTSAYPHSSLSPPSNQASTDTHPAADPARAALKQRRLAAFRPAPDPPRRLHVVRLEGVGRVLLDVAPPGESGGGEPAKKRRRQATGGSGGGGGGSGSGSGSGSGHAGYASSYNHPHHNHNHHTHSSPTSDPLGPVTAPNWPDGEFPWSARAEERAALMRWERAAKDALLERFFDEEEEWAVDVGGEGGGEGGGA
ncbi:hypothetical protein GGG16DRAFT_106609 [Schizophyllum commune]